MKKLIIILIAWTAMACSSDEPSIDIPVIDIPINLKYPNILLIIADDMGIEATPGYEIGAIKPNMPNLDNLTNMGITFDNVWAYPVCSPTRSSILTGRYGYRTGVLNAEDASTIPSSEKSIHAYLNENTISGYSHAIIGKWHLSNNEPLRPTQMGVDYYAGLLGGGVGDYFSWPLTENGSTNTFNGYITTKITDLAIDWIGEQAEPWFCWVAYTAPHTPLHLPPDSMHTQGSLPSDEASIEANPIPYFMAMIESVDFEMGRILRSMPADVLDNTVVIFIGDNGTSNAVIQSPYISTQAKGSLYQGGVHVPMIVSGKGVSRCNVRDNTMISSTDLFATVAEIAGADLPNYEDSYSFNNVLTQSTTGLREFNYSEVLNDFPNRSGYTIRNSQYKWIQFDSGQQRFFDLIADPYEQSNLLDGTLTSAESEAMQSLMDAAGQIRQ